MYGRSPAMPYQQYSIPPPVVTSPSYPQPLQSPAIVTSPYQAPPSSTPSSAHSSYVMPVRLPLQSSAPIPAPMEAPAPNPVPSAAPTPASPTASQPMQSSAVPENTGAPETDKVAAEAAEPTLPSTRSPYRPPLPWLSRPDLPWPAKTPRRRKRRTLPDVLATVEADVPAHTEQDQAIELNNPATDAATLGPRPETPSTAQPPSEDAPSTTPTTPSSVQQTPQPQSAQKTSTSTKVAPRNIALPLIPALPVAKHSPTASDSKQKPVEPAASEVKADAHETPQSSAETQLAAETTEAEEVKPAPAVAGPPKSWANLFKGAAHAAARSDNSQPTGSSSAASGGFVRPTNESLSDALTSFDASAKDAKVAFLEPRGLVNTGNMCYMNSVLQVLVSCVPFYDFLDQVGKKAAHSFKSDTPLIDAMIMFMREFPIIDSAHGVEQLRMRLKDNELEKYGDAFTPDFVYEVIRTLPRFASMRRGHQQDAEEFLGFLLEGLHDECVHVIQTTGSTEASAAGTPNVPSSPVLSTSGSVAGEAQGWLEVGPKQKAAVTRSSGTRTDSPITKIFGGTLRSVLRVPGLKDSVTMEPFQPLQLDIHLPSVHNIIDALKGLTKPETITGDFKSPRGANVTATKQLSIETLPPVLILHLKRFQYDNSGGTQKIWKKIGYPLELEIPKDVFARQKQGSILNHGGLPKYRLSAVVYHHGKNASGGHYTVDVRRQDGREWIRLDDTIIKRVKAEDVAEGGSEEDPKVLAAALEAHKKDTVSSSNIFAQMNDEEDVESNEWKQVNGEKVNGTAKKWSGVVNGASTPKPKGAADKFNIHDNKVAYLLFYQRME